jgi:methylenetetrahydrofolate reductase (NADPH)
MTLTKTFKDRLETNEMLVIAELTPPQNADTTAIRTATQKLEGTVHAVGLSDNRDGVGMSPTAAAAIVKDAGVEPLVHMVTRDRNRIALESDFLGARALGLSNILCTTGTHQTLGKFKAAKNVFDVDSVQLLKILSTHNASNGSTCLGATASPYAEPAALQLMRLQKKSTVGARFIITQPVFDLKRFATWWSEVKASGLHKRSAIIAGIRPLLRRDDAAAYAQSRPNPRIPEAVLRNVTDATSDDAARTAGIEIAVQTITELKSMTGIRGFEICVQDDVDATLAIIDNAGLRVS